MKGKPLINEFVLQKISKPPTFVVRSKCAPSKSLKKERSAQNFDVNDQITNSKIDNSIQILQKYVQNDQPLCKEDCLGVIKLLVEIKNRANLFQSSEIFEDMEDSSPLPIRKSENKYKSKTRLNTLEDKQTFISEKGGVDFAKSRAVKLHLGKENNNRNTIALDMKTQQLQSKLAEYEKQMETSRTKTILLSQKVQKLSFQLKQQEVYAFQLFESKKQLSSKASSLVLAQMEAQKKMKQEILEMEHEVSKVSLYAKQLNERLNEREWEIVSLFQSNNF